VGQASAKEVKNGRVGSIVTGCVAIPAQGADIGPALVDSRLDALCAQAKVSNALAPALRTVAGLSLAVVAVVTDQVGITAVVREGGIAIRATDNVSTVSTENKGCGSSPVEEQDHLLAMFQGVVHRLLKGSAKDGAVTGPQLRPQINDLHRG
jgi:hypothetical protein